LSSDCSPLDAADYWNPKIERREFSLGSLFYSRFDPIILFYSVSLSLSDALSPSESSIKSIAFSSAP